MNANTEPSRRRVHLGIPIEIRSGISRRHFLVGAGAVLAAPAVLGLSSEDALAAAEARPGTTRVRVRLLDAATGKPTPAMACIRKVDSAEVRLPGDGRVCQKPSTVREFTSGVKFSADPNWIGPVRKMQGRGDNNDRSYVYEDRPSVPYWKEPVSYLTSGDFFIDLPAGQWRISASHGIEFVPVIQDIQVNGQPQVEQNLALKRWIDLPARGWWSGDVHVHHPSRDAAEREFLMQYALAEDVHVVNLLEMGHHQGTEFPQAGFGSRFRTQRGNFALVSGQEDPRSTFGHIIGLNLEAMVRDLRTYDFYDATFRGIHAQKGALVGFAHFAWNGCDLPRGFPWFVTSGEIDFIELLQFGLLNRLDYAAYLNLGFRLTAAAGSDIPWGSTIGEVRTYVHTGGGFDVDSWFRNLKAGHTFVSNGPAIEFSVDGGIPGAEIKRTGAGVVKIRARALGHPGVGLPTVLRVEGPAGALKEVKSAAGEAELGFELEHRVENSQWLMASAVCENGSVANTTPVYVVMDGKPTWDAQQGPAIIDKQLSAMARIEAEVATGTDERTAGIRKRLRQARLFYADLRRKMAAG